MCGANHEKTIARGRGNHRAAAVMSYVAIVLPADRGQARLDAGEPEGGALSRTDLHSGWSHSA